MIDSRAVLVEHPSVQDLDVKCNKVNDAKVAYNKMLINAGPLTNADVSRKAKKEAKGQTAVTERFEKNLINAANRPRSDVNATKYTSSKNKPPLVPKSAMAGVAAAAPKRKAASSSSNVSGDGSSLPALTRSSLKGTPLKGRAPSVLTSVVSFDGTDAESFSVYTCSCCQIRPPSSVASRGHTAGCAQRGSKTPSLVPTTTGCSQASVTNYSDYDNMTSISQRIAQKSNSGAGGGGHRHHQHSGGSRASATSSVASSKLRDLESQLAKEREDRLKTQQDLKQIQERQKLLMSKLSERERAEFGKVVDS